MELKSIPIIVAASLLLMSKASAKASYRANTNSSNAFSAEKAWTGFYLGVNGGYAWGSSHAWVDSSVTNATYLTSSDIASLRQTGNFHLGLSGFTGGFQVGYNWCTGCNLLIGLETDFGGLFFEESKSTTHLYPGYTNTSYTVYQKVETDWLYTLRPRIGYALRRTLFYVTGGLSLTNLKYKEVFSDNYYTVYQFAPGYNADQKISKNQTAVGWTAGAGVEYLFTKHFSLGLSYLYANFGEFSYKNTLTVELAGGLYNNPIKDKVTLDANILRLSLNWQI